MSLVAFLLEKRTPLELAKELAATAKEKASLQDLVFALQHEVFWMKVAERNTDNFNLLGKDRWDSTSFEAEFHKAIKPILSKRDQGRVMGAFRESLTKGK